MYYVHCSVLSLWLSSTFHILLYSPLYFWIYLILSLSQPPDSSLYQTFHCWFLSQFCLQPLYMEWHSPSSLTKTLLGLLHIKLKAFLFPKQQTCHDFHAALLSSWAPCLFVVCWTCMHIKFCIVNISMRVCVELTPTTCVKYNHEED